MKKILLTIFAFFFLFASRTFSEELRTWTDSTGRFKIKASLVRIQDTEVVLKKEDGKFQTVPLDKLAQEDQDYIAALQQENPFADAASDNPFAGGTTTMADVERQPSIPNRPAPPRREPSIDQTKPASNAHPFEEPPVKIDFQSARKVEGATNTSWSCKADAPVAAITMPSLRSVVFNVGEVPFGVFPKQDGFFVYAQEKVPKILAVTTINRTRSREGTSTSFVHFGDPVAGKCFDLKFPQRLTLFGVSPSGTKAVFVEGDWKDNEFDIGGIVHVVGMNGTKLVPIASYEPFASTGHPSRVSRPDREQNIQWMDWIDDQHLMIISNGGQLIVLDIKNNTVVWTLNKAVRNTKVFFSPEKRYCLIANYSSTPFLLESLTGNIIGVLETKRKVAPISYAFSTDGKTIASCGSGHIELWDATTGKVDELFYVGSYPHTFLSWVDERFLLLDGRLIDTQTKSLIWYYQLPGQSARYGKNMQRFRGVYWFTSAAPRGPKTVVTVKIPHPKALLAARSTESELFCIRPGMEVSLTIEHSVQKNRPAIQKKMEDILRKNEWKLVPNAALSMVLKVIQEEGILRYGTGFLVTDGENTDITYSPKRFSLEIQLNGRVLWSESKLVEPDQSTSIGQIHNESLRSSIARSVNEENEKYDAWFLSVEIPKKIPNMNSLGSSSLTISGITDKVP